MNWTEYFKAQLPDMLTELGTYVSAETPTHRKDCVDKLGGYIRGRFEALGCTVDVIPQSETGNQLRCTFGKGPEQLLVLGHFDTVKDVGTLAAEPWRVELGKAYGPGSYDMKAGIVSAYFALKAIVDQGVAPQKRIVFFWNTDEEIGSPSSTPHIEAEARQSQLALVVEPAHGAGMLKTSRKSGGDFHIEVFGRAAHAGNDHQAGVNAIEELARQILTVQSWTDYDTGTTLSVGTIDGGSATNVIPAHAHAVVDARASRRDEADRITEMMYALKPHHPEAEVRVSGGFSKLPMERTAAVERLFLHAASEAAEEGFKLEEIGVGGTSDGNIAAAVGCPALDGLGPVGDGAHAVGEHVVIDEMPRRTALLLRLLTTL